MNLEVISVLLAILVLVGAAFAWMGWRKIQRTPHLERIERGLDALAQAQELLHRQLTQRLQDQERAFGVSVNKRLDDVSQRVGDSLLKNAEKNQQQLTALGERLAVIDSAQRDMTKLSQQVTSLQDILTNKQTRGRFGEERLEDIVRDQLPPDYWAFQKTLSNGKRADCVITMPPPTGTLAVDAKFPLDDYKAIVTAEGAQDERERHRKAFAAAVKRHIIDISEKYIIPGETFDTALMFVPSEAIYAEIHTEHPSVIDQARARHVVIVSPNTLWAMIGTMRAIIRDQHMREKADQIRREVLALLEDTRRITERIDKLRSSFNQAAEVIGKIETSRDKILRRGEKIQNFDLAGPREPALEADGEADPSPALFPRRDAE